MLSYYERNVDFLEIEIGSLPLKSNVKFSLAEHILPELQKSAEDGKAIYLAKKNTASLHVHSVDIDEVNEVATLLLHYTDTNLTDPAFKNMLSGSVRVAGKDKGEGVAVSAHLLIDINTFKGVRNAVHLALLEVVPGINKSLIKNALTSIFRHKISNWTYRANNEKKRKSCRPNFKLDNLAADDLSDGLKTRRLTGVTLVRKSLEDDFDEDVLTQTESEVKFAIGANLREEAAEKLLYRLSGKAKSKGYSTLKVKYEDDNGSSKTGKFPSLDKETIKRAAGVFCKRDKIYVDEKIDQCQEDLHPLLVNKSKSLLLKERGGESAESDTEKTVQAALLSQGEA